MPSAITFVLNGRPVRVEDFSPNLTLLEYLRGRGLTGAKEGCAEGDCGACTVLLIDRDARGQPLYHAINSCLTPVTLMAGREIVTVEGVANSGLHAVQEQMARAHGSQCGYCTPGFVMALYEGHRRGRAFSAEDLNEQLAGNLCRCTGYRPIRDAAALALKPKHPGPRGEPSAAAVLAGVEYECRGERFFRPGSLAELLRLVAEHKAARLIAGATEMGLEITKKYRRFQTLISVEAVPELAELTSTPAEWRIGAAATLTRVDEAMGQEFPALRDMLRVFGSRQIRNRATLGGNLATASPIGDGAPVLMALDARVVLAAATPRDRAAGSGNGADGRDRQGVAERTLTVEEFLVGYRKTALQPGEIIKTILVPRQATAQTTRTLCRWYKVSRRREMDISTVAACFRIDTDELGVVTDARLAYGGVAPMTMRARETERSLIGKAWDADTVRQALPILAVEFTPISDVRGSAEYRRGLVTSLFEKFFCETSTGVEHEAEPAPPSPPAFEPDSEPHESAHTHATGEALYTDDISSTQPALDAWPVCAPHAHARIRSIDATAARACPGIKAVLLARDIPGLNNAGAVKRDEPLLAEKEVCFQGQIVALVVGESLEACRAAAEKVAVAYEPLPAVFAIEEAIAARSFHNRPNFIRRGNVGRALARSELTLSGAFEMGGQEHFYLETHAALALPGEAGAMKVISSTQHPSEVEAGVAHVLDVPVNKVVVECPRVGGGFGGKETQAALPAGLAALAARVTGRPVRIRWNRDQDMMLTGHRHPFLARFKVGFDREGRLRAARIHLWSNGGWAMDLSQAVTDRALFHLDNAYYIPAVEFRGQVAKTNLASNTAFRGFGGPQGMVVIEEILDRVARALLLPPELVRERNLYHGRGETNTTHYGQSIKDNRIGRVWSRVKANSGFDRRRREIAAWNAGHPHRKRGLAITPVKFGISFTVTHLNQAGALVHIYQDGSVQVNHAAVEMGQGVHTNIGLIAARELGVPPGQVRVMPTSTDKVPNTSATAASCGTDLNGAAVQSACAVLRGRLARVAAKLLADSSGRRPRVRDLLFCDGVIKTAGTRGRKSLPFAETVRHAYLERVSLSAAGFYATPRIHYDRAAGRGEPFYYFAWGAAVTEVEVDGFTGMTRVLRVDIVQDAGQSINAGVNRGQVEGGFIQGMGWLTMEELRWDGEGRLQTHSPDTYKIPAIGDTPRVFNVELLAEAAQPGVVYGSKAVGEPPFMLAISVREAIRDAIAAFGEAGGQVPLPVPATGEAIYLAIRRRRAEWGIGNAECGMRDPNIEHRTLNIER